MRERRRKRLYFHFRQPEGLEMRDLLSGHAIASGISHFAAAAQVDHFHANNAATEFLAAHSQVFAALGQNFATADHTVLTATLSDPNNSSVSGTATYKTYTSNGVTETEFSVSVTGETANTTFDVSVDGAVVGQITTNDNGAGSLKLSSDASDTDDSPLPANFPTTITGGVSQVLVGTSLTGTLAAPTSTGGGCGGQHESNRTVLTASLTDPDNSSASGTVIYKTGRSHDGTTYTKLVVSVTGAAASTTLPVSIDGTQVGEITTDDTGAGKLVLSSNPHGSQTQLPSNFPTTITADTTTITVGTLSGTFTTPSSSTSFGHFSRHR